MDVDTEGDQQQAIQAMLNRGDLEQARRHVFSAAALEMLENGWFPSNFYRFYPLTNDIVSSRANFVGEYCPTY